MRRTRRRGRRLARAVTALAIAVLAAACSPGPGNSAQPGVSQHHQVVTLDNISTLRSLFNRDDGHTRLVLIFSPT